MVDDRMPFWLTVVLTTLGLAIILYGVTLNYGAEFNAPMIVGGAVMLLGIGALTMWIISIDEAAAEDESHA